MAKKESVVEQNKREVKEKQDKAKKENKEMKKLSVKQIVIGTIITTALLTAGTIYLGMRTYEHIYNQGFNAANEKHAAVVEQAAKLSTELKPQQ